MNFNECHICKKNVLDITNTYRGFNYRCKECYKNIKLNKKLIQNLSCFSCGKAIDTDYHRNYKGSQKVCKKCFRVQMKYKKKSNNKHKWNLFKVICPYSCHSTHHSLSLKETEFVCKFGCCNENKSNVSRIIGAVCSNSECNKLTNHYLFIGNDNIQDLRKFFYTRSLDKQCSTCIKDQNFS